MMSYEVVLFKSQNRMPCRNSGAVDSLIDSGPVLNEPHT